MSSRLLSRERGCVISCDHGIYEGEGEPCETQVYTAVIRVKPTRKYAASLGWIRGGGNRKRRDYCPAHAPAELERVAAEQRLKAERKQQRAAERKAKLAANAAAKAA